MRRRAEAARIRMRRYRERMSQKKREDILDRRRQSRHEEAMSVRNREDYLQNERNGFQSRIQSMHMTQKNTFSSGILQLKIYIETKILQLKNIYCN